MSRKSWAVKIRRTTQSNNCVLCMGDHFEAYSFGKRPTCHFCHCSMPRRLCHITYRTDSPKKKKAFYAVPPLGYSLHHTHTHTLEPIRYFKFRSNMRNVPKYLHILIVHDSLTILIPINLVPNFTHRGSLVIRGHRCNFSQPSAPLGYKQTVSRGRW